MQIEILSDLAGYDTCLSTEWGDPAGHWQSLETKS
jgi:hypothetical protein